MYLFDRVSVLGSALAIGRYISSAVDEKQMASFTLPRYSLRVLTEGLGGLGDVNGGVRRSNKHHYATPLLLALYPNASI
jgi:hypothetical protein